jgi:DNA mismatch repair protein MutS2
LRREVAAELSKMREDSTRRAQASASRVLEAAGTRIAAGEPVLAEAEREAERASGELSVGGRARLRGGKAVGTVLAREGESVWIEVGGKRLRLSASELEPLAPAAAARPVSRPPSGGAAGPPLEVSTREVNVIGKRLDEATEEVERAIDAAILSGEGRIRVVHGHGTGRLRDGLRAHLRSHRAVGSLRAADPREGGNGATIVELG